MVKLTLEILNNLDIKVGRIIGLLQNPKYSNSIKSYLKSEYGIDDIQCRLWWECTQLLAHILDNNDYEDLFLSEEELGFEAKKVLAAHEDSFNYVKQLLLQYDILHNNEEIGKTLYEIMEDIQDTYKYLEKDIRKILPTQEEIEQWID